MLAAWDSCSSNYRSEIDLSAIPGMDGVPYGQLFNANVSQTHRELMGLAEVRGVNQPIFEGLANHQNEHGSQSISTDLLRSGMENPGSTQLPAIESFDRTSSMSASRSYPGELRFPRDQRSPMLGHQGSHSRSTVKSPLEALDGNGKNMPWSIQQRNQAFNGPIDNEAYANVPYPRSSPKIPPSAVQLAIEKADQVSKEITSDITKSMRGNASPEEMQLIIRTKVLSLLSPSSSSTKRSSDDAGLDNSSDVSGKRVACSICSKQMGRPCDIK